MQLASSFCVKVRAVAERKPQEAVLPQLNAPSVLEATGLLWDELFNAPEVVPLPESTLNTLKVVSERISDPTVVEVRLHLQLLCMKVTVNETPTHSPMPPPVALIRLRPSPQSWHSVAPPFTRQTA